MISLIEPFRPLIDGDLWTEEGGGVEAVRPTLLPVSGLKEELIPWANLSCVYVCQIGVIGFTGSY